ncbi:unnamed protein product [Brassica napus]|uniref:(rape) hypothetical protein n=1 Tax=Brassica napus TaxID=3708 RepID=A0A817B2V9_BRANA|nr:unnamed protein product [Brassica napus]
MSKQLQVTFIVLTIFIVFVLEVVGDRDSDSQFGCEERLNMTTEDTCSRLECQFQCTLKRKGWATCFKDADDLYKGTPFHPFSLRHVLCHVDKSNSPMSTRAVSLLLWKFILSIRENNGVLSDYRDDYLNQQWSFVRVISSSDIDTSSSKRKLIPHGNGNESTASSSTNSKSKEITFKLELEGVRQATDSHSLAERAIGENISEMMTLLQDLVLGGNRITGKQLCLICAVLAETRRFLLQCFVSICKAGQGVCESIDSVIVREERMNGGDEVGASSYLVRAVLAKNFKKVQKKHKYDSVKPKRP